MVGAGALGIVYAQALQLAGADVTCILRPGRSLPLWTKRRSLGDPGPIACKFPTATRVSNADVIVIAVRSDQIEAALLEQLPWSQTEPRARSVVCLTPVMPRTRQQLQALGQPLSFALPGVAALRVGAGVEYWQPPLARTELERGEGPHAERVLELAGLLTAGGLPTRLSPEVFWRNVALTTSFFPLSYALHVQGSLQALTRNPRALQPVGKALAETIALAKKLGPVPWPLLALPASVQLGLLPWAVTLARLLAPQGVEFLDVHFGAKLPAQHELLAREILALGTQHAVPLEHLERMVAEHGRSRPAGGGAP